MAARKLVAEGLLPAAARNLTQALEGCMSDKLRSDGIPNVSGLAERAKASVSRWDN